jgi:hypothetical protein
MNHPTHDHVAALTFNTSTCTSLLKTMFEHANTQSGTATNVNCIKTGAACPKSKSSRTQRGRLGAKK